MGTEEFAFAPYNFVPHSQTVLLASQNDIAQASQDVPLPNGLCGHIDLSLCAANYLLVGGEQNGVQDGIKQVKFFTAPDGQYAIPGSSLRGMLSNVLKVAMFGKLNQVDDKRLAMRDLSSAAKRVYQQEFTEEKGRKAPPEYFSKVKAGWLSFDGHVWHVAETEMARVESLPRGGLSPKGSTLYEWAKKITEGAHHTKFFERKWRDLFGVPRNNETGANGARLTKKELVEVYGCWEEFCKVGNYAFPLMPVKCSVGPAMLHSHNKKKLHYRKVGALGEGDQDGILVLTGHPGSQKHMEFVFFDQAIPGKKRALSELEFQNFRMAYQASPSWKFWMQKYQAGLISRIPIFFLEANHGDKAGLRLGFTQLFKLPVKYSLHEAIKNTAAEHLERRPDYVELIFGRLDEPGQQGDEQGWQRKGRVDFSLARLDSALQAEAVSTYSCLISPGSPRPSFFPNYVRQVKAELSQKSSNAGQPENAFQKLAVLKKALPESAPQRMKFSAVDTGNMQTLLHKGAQLRGWKRYQVKRFDNVELAAREQQMREDLNAQQQGAQLLRLNFIHAKSGPLRFQLRLRFHNLQPFELGALLWGLTFGELGKSEEPSDLSHRKHFHSLGMGKPYGAGAVQCIVQQLHYRANAQLAAGFQVEQGAQLVDKQSQTQLCLRAFTERMEAQVNGWQNTRQIRNLLKMAEMLQGDQPNWRYMKLRAKKEEQNPPVDFYSVKAKHLRLREPEEF